MEEYIRFKQVSCSAMAVVFLFALSFLGWKMPVVGSWVALFLSASIFILYFHAPQWAVATAIAELAFGGKGWWLSLDLWGEPLPIRILLFAALLTAWIVQSIRLQSEVKRLLHAVPRVVRAPLGLLAVSIAWGIAWGFVRGNGMAATILDANAYGYWLLLPPVLSAIAGEKKRSNYFELFSAIVGASMAVSVLTLMLYHVFDHQYAIADTLYRWMRATLLGEITFIRPGAWRIFMQSQVWLLLVWSWAVTSGIARFFLRREPGNQDGISPAKNDHRVWREKIWVGLILVLSSSSLMISFSRSLWVGWGTAIMVISVINLKHRTIPVQPMSSIVHISLMRSIRCTPRIRHIGRIAYVLALSSVGGFLLTMMAQRIPPVPAGFPLKERISFDEAGSSRVQQLKPLMKAIARHPVIGSGFGATVTYRSSDPRVVAGTAGGTGEYTTYAFEWGYLDIWLKIGLIGLISYIGLIGRLLVYFWRLAFPQGVGALQYVPEGSGVIVVTLLLSLIALAVVNIFSPYLNHPLGIGMVVVGIIAVVTLEKQKKPGVPELRDTPVMYDGTMPS